MRSPLIAAVAVLLLATPAVILVAPGVAQAQLSTWITDSRTGCRVWDQVPQPSETVTWSGACPNGVAEGNGVLQWYESGRPGDRYEGEMHGGKQSGHAVITSNTGLRYDGEFRDGNMNGYGTFTYPSGDRFEGEWRNGKPNGLGKFISVVNGTFYGNWTDGCFKDGDRKAAVGVPASACK